jgi:glutamate--cysteine ligase
MVPHLTTALTGPINELEQRMLESMPAIERWFRLEWMEHTPAFYAAVDLRNAGFKLAPVDTDLFPDVFGNLTVEMLPLAVQAAMAAIEKICPEAKNLLLVPDGRTGNSFYLTSVQRLVQIFTQAGLNVRLGSLDESLREPRTLALPDGSELVLEPLVRTRGRLGLKDFDPCTILLNNDLRGGAPAALQGLHEQYLLPPLHAGWGVRRKSRHFQSYEEVAKKFAKLLGMDPWLIVPMSARCGEVALDRPEGLEAIKAQADAMLAKVRRKYKEYGIGERPFVVVKSDDASGAGVLTVRDPKDLDDPARQQRCRLLSAPVASRPGARGGSGRPAEPDRPEAKGGGSAELIVQEGVPTYERINDAVAEPVVVTIDRYVVGGFYRVHAERGTDENLNAPGSSYVPLAFDQASQLPRPGAKPGASAPNRFYMYGVIGRLAMLAAAYELEATDPEAEVYE